MQTPPIDALVNAFLAWPLPASVCSDSCVSQYGYPNRSGTNLLTASETRQMFEAVLAKAGAMDFKQRVIAEKSELDDRIGKLRLFLVTATCKSLASEEQIRLDRQASAMQEYSNILGERISAFK